jgi:hypothetical protein
MFIISKTLMYLFKSPSSCVNMTVKISSNEIFFTTSTHLAMSSKSSQNYLLISSFKPTYGVYTLMTFKTKSPITNLIMMILSLCLLIAITPFLRFLSIKMLTPFLLHFFPMYHSLNLVFYISLAF